MPINASDVQYKTNLAMTQESVTNLFLGSVYHLTQTNAGAHVGAGVPQFLNLTST